MPTWPSSDVSTTNLDAASDRPDLARSDLRTAVDNLNTIRVARGAADGVASLDSAGKVPTAQIPLVPFANGIVAIETPGSSSWTVPAGVTKVQITVVGAGGGGGYTTTPNDDHGGGGGAGGVLTKLLTVTPGDSLSYTVGSGGQGAASGPSDGNGASGGNSSVTYSAVTYTANGGGGGTGGSTVFGGGGGICSNGDINAPGGAGQTGDVKGGLGGSNAMTGSSAERGSSFPKYGGGGYGSGDGGGDAYNGGHGAAIFTY